LLALGCDDGEVANPPGDGGPDSGADSGADGGYDCAALPSGPFELVQVPGAIASKDVAFDAEGNLVGASDTVIYKTSPEGIPDSIVTNIYGCSGLAFLPNGSLMYADEGRAELLLFNGTNSVAIDIPLHSPQGVIVDQEGLVYVADPPLERITRVDPYTFESTVVVEGLFGAVAMTFDADYDRLFVVTKGEGDSTVYYVDIDPDGTPGEVEVFATDVGDGWHVGLGMDTCDNLYVVEHQCDGVLWRSCIFRVSADGVVENEPLVVRDDSYLAGIEWGSGLASWSANTLYVGEVQLDMVFRMDIGVPSKPRVYP
jgi:sugar lactone lactonase YvrE